MHVHKKTSIEMNAPYWAHRDNTLSLGCQHCEEFGICGGLKIEHPAMDCMEFCSCKDPTKCGLPCLKNPKMLVARFREVGGWNLLSVPRASTVRMPELPAVIPIIYQKNRRLDSLDSAAVAICLHSLFNKRTGAPKFNSKEEVALKFKFDPRAALVIVGVGKDRGLEAYWERARNRRFPEALKRLNPAMVTTPNFSLFTSVVRWDNFHSMKRIAICWQEMADAGLPASLHLNARTDRDYERWVEFLIQREEINSVTFEFGTGAGIPARAQWHVDWLCKVGERTQRRLLLLVRGGLRHVKVLQKYYKSTVLIDSNSFMKAESRRILDIKNGQATWVPAITLQNQAIDALLQHNVNEIAKFKLG